MLEENRMDTTIQDTLFFFDRHQAVYPLYERFQEKLLVDEVFHGCVHVLQLAKPLHSQMNRDRI